MTNSQQLQDLNISENTATFIGAITVIILLIIAFDLGVIIGRQI